MKNDNPPIGNSVAELVAMYSSQLKGFISKRVPSKEDVEDILQDVFYQLAKADMDGQSIEQVSGWLYAVARNRITDKWKKQKEELSSDYAVDESRSFIQDIELMLFDKEVSPEVDYLKSMIWEELELALAELPPEQRVVFELTELEGFSFKEISESTGVPVNTLLSRKRYAVLFLRKRLYDLYAELIEE